MSAKNKFHQRRIRETYNLSREIRRFQFTIRQGLPNCFRFFARELGAFPFPFDYNFFVQRRIIRGDRDQRRVPTSRT